MAYSAPITREHPACLIFLLDQSESMGEPLGEDQPVRRADFVADTVNRMLQNLVIRCGSNGGSEELLLRFSHSLRQRRRTGLRWYLGRSNFGSDL